MKANAPKRKVFADAMDLLTDTIEQVKGVASIAIDAIVPFHDHPFHLTWVKGLDVLSETTG